MTENLPAITIPEIERMAAAVAASRLFGMQTKEQAMALMLIAHAEGRHPALAARDYNIIQGRPSKAAEAMLRDFLDAGGNVEWHRLDDELADATFSHSRGGTARISRDIARAAKAGLGGKDNWKKFPRQMLRCRVISEGVRTIYPKATSGLYAPEELQNVKQPKMKDITPKEVAIADVRNAIAARKEAADAAPQPLESQAAGKQDEAPPEEAASPENVEPSPAEQLLEIAESIAKSQGSAALKEWFSALSMSEKKMIKNSDPIWQAIKAKAARTDAAALEAANG